MKRIVVTGASGFIGRHVLPLLVERGWEVHGLCFPKSTQELPGVIWHTVDLLDPAGYGLFREIGASHLLHLAWYAEPGKYWGSAENFRWVRGSLDLLDAFRAAGGEHVVAAGTCAEYDWDYGYLREDVTPLAPATVYGRSKRALHQLFELYGELHRLRITWGRVFFLYGPHEAAGRLVPSVTEALLRGVEARCTHGGQIRDFLHVKDVAAAFVALVEGERAGAVNIGSGEPITLRALVNLIASELGCQHMVRLGALAAPPGEAPLVVADNRRLLDCGWHPCYPVERGISDTVAWWRSAGNTFDRECAR